MALRSAKMTISTLERILGSPLDDEIFDGNPAPGPYDCFWHKGACNTPKSCLEEANRRVIQANAIIVYMHRKVARAQGKPYEVKNQAGNNDDGHMLAILLPWVELMSSPIRSRPRGEGRQSSSASGEYTVRVTVNTEEDLIVRNHGDRLGHSTCSFL